MSTHTITLPADVEAYATAKVDSGMVGSLDELLTTALRRLEADDADEHAKLIRLRELLAEGDASGIFEGDPFEHVRRKLGLTSVDR